MGGIQTLYSTMHLVPFIVCMYVCMHVYLYVCYYLVFIYLFPRRPAPSITLPTAPPCAGAAPPQGSYTHPNPPPLPRTGPGARLTCAFLDSGGNSGSAEV